MSASRPYCTPDGQVVSQARQVRQRSRCRRVLAVDRRALQRLLDEVDAPARAVQLVAQQLVGRAGRGAEAAVHALAQDGVGLAPLGRVADEIGQLSLHGAGRYTRRMKIVMALIVLAIVAGGAAWIVIALRKCQERKAFEQERAASFVARC